MVKRTEKDVRIKAKKLRTLLLVVWTVMGDILLILIQTIADKHELQKTVSVFIWAYVFFSTVVAGGVARLTKIMKKAATKSNELV